MTTRIYLDNNAGTILDPNIAEQLIPILGDLQGNPSSNHFPGQRARNLISRARNSVAAYLNSRPNEIVFTSGGTESANMVIQGILTRNNGHLITSKVEHSCVFAQAKQYESNHGKVTFLSPDFGGIINPEDVKRAIQPDTKLIALMAANNETGVKTDVEAIAAIAKDYNIPFFVDGVALLGKEPFSIPQGVTAMGFSGHKLHALQGVGFVFIRSSFKFPSFLQGGEQELGRRAGTENVLGIFSLGKAIELLKDLPIVSERMKKLRDEFENILIRALPDVLINGNGSRIANVSNLAFLRADGEALLMGLDQAGISVSHGSACASGTLEPSRVLLNMGLPLDRVRTSIRFSLSRFTTQEEIIRASKTIISIVNRLRGLAF